MKKLQLMVLVTVLFSASLAGAILSPSPDQLGLYFDTGADHVCIDGIAPFATVPMYLIYTRPTPEAILGVSAGLHVEGPMMILDVDIPGGSVIPTDPFRWMGSWSSPQPTSEAMVIVSFSVLYMSTDLAPVSFYLGSFDEPQGGLPEIQMSDGSLIQMEMIFPTGFWMAGINEGCTVIPVSTETLGFGAMKALYR